jgi:hypothetical protein
MFYEMNRYPLLILDADWIDGIVDPVETVSLTRYKYRLKGRLGTDEGDGWISVITIIDMCDRTYDICERT